MHVAVTTTGTVRRANLQSNCYRYTDIYSAFTARMPSLSSIHSVRALKDEAFRSNQQENNDLCYAILTCARRLAVKPAWSAARPKNNKKLS